MAIITISGGAFAGSARLAQLLGKQLGYRTVSRAAVLDRSRDVYGIGERALVEAVDRVPAVVGTAVRESRKILAAVQACLCDLLADDDVVYHGQVGNLALRDVEHLLRVRLLVPREARVRLAMEREGLSEFDAGRTIDLIDVGRARWARFFHGVDWNDPALYDVVLNLQLMSIEDAAATLAHMATLPSYVSAPATLKRVRDLSLVARVRVQLLHDPGTADLELALRADGGHVRVAGLVGEKHLARVTEVLHGVPGVEEIDVAPALSGA